MHTNLAYIYGTVDNIEQAPYLHTGTLALFEQYESSGANDAAFDEELDDDCCDLYAMPS